MLSVATEDLPKPEQPEILSIQRQMKFLGLAWWSGGLEAQPLFLSLELQRCQNALSDFEARMVINSRLKNEWAAKRTGVVN